MSRRESAKRRQAERDATEDVGVQLVLSFDLLESLLPIGGSEFEDAVSGPAGEQAEEVTQVAEGLDVVQATTGEQRDECGVGFGTVVTAQKEPIAPAEHLTAQVQFTDIVVQGQSAIVEETAQREALIEGVADGGGGRGLVKNLVALGFAPLKELPDKGPRSAIANGLTFLRGASATVRSMRKSSPMRASACLLRSGSDSSAENQYRRQ